MVIIDYTLYLKSGAETEGTLEVEIDVIEEHCGQEIDPDFQCLCFDDCEDCIHEQNCQNWWIHEYAVDKLLDDEIHKGMGTVIDFI